MQPIIPYWPAPKHGHWSEPVFVVCDVWGILSL